MTRTAIPTVLRRRSLGVPLALAVSLGIPVTSTCIPAPAAAAVDLSTAHLFPDLISPKNVQWDYSPAEVGVRFTTNSDGLLSGLRFFKNRFNNGPHDGHVWDANGTLLSTVKFQNETPSGWQSAALTQPLRLKAGQTYVVSYRAEWGRYSFDAGYFGKALTIGPLNAPVNAGVIRTWDASGNARTSFTTDNPWVDVEFHPTMIRGIQPRTQSALTPSPAPNPPVMTRDKNVQPFASTSIWNMPVGSGAAYIPLKLSAPTIGFGTDEEYLTFTPGAPLRRLLDRGYWWPFAGSLSGKDLGVAVHVPDSWIVPPPASGELPNRASAALRSDGLAQEFQYTVRPSSASDISVFEGLRATMDLAGDGLTPPGQVGAHGGSGMTGIGGTLRVGELTGPDPIRHALAVTMNMKKWGTAQGGNVTNGYRWPAVSADGYYNRTGFATGYGTINTGGGGPRDGLGMGSLLALPSAVDLGSLNFETPQGAKLGWTYQNYGAYVVDDSYDPGDWDVHRLNVEAGVLKEFPGIDTGYTTDTPFGRDMVKIFTRLAVIDNNAPDKIGGGGIPRQPLAGPLAN